MRPEYRELRLRQLTLTLGAFETARGVTRPQHGWLRAIREALGLTFEQIGRSIGSSRANIQSFENAEANDRITLRTLRRVAAAMDCDLVYAIIPKSGTILELAERRFRAEATKHVNSVEHTMMLENQAVGNTSQLIDQAVKKFRTPSR
jgi:predicted DNA-binding mobile mystery protein A